MIIAHAPLSSLVLGIWTLLVGLPSRGPDKPTLQIVKMEPANGTVLLAGTRVRFEAEISFTSSSHEDIEIAPVLFVNGCLYHPAVFQMTPGTAVSGKISWDVCVGGRELDVRLALNGKGLESASKLTSDTLSQLYPVAYPCPVCCYRASPCMRGLPRRFK